MQTIIRRGISAIILAALSIMMLAACKPSGSGDGTVNKPGTPAAASGYVYVPSYTDLPAEVTEVNYPALVGDTIYFVQNIVIGQRTEYWGKGEGGEETLPMPLVRYYDENGNIEPLPDDVGSTEGEDYYTYDISEQRLFSVKMDGTEYKQIYGYKLPAPPETAPEGTQYYLNTFKVIDETSAWVNEQGWFGYEDDKGNWVDDQQTIVRKISLETGETLAELDFALIKENDPYANFYNLNVDGSGNLLGIGYNNNGGNTIYVFAADGSLAFSETITNDVGWINQILVLPDGRAAISIYESKSNNELLKPIDIANKKIGESLGSMPVNAWNIIGATPDGKDLIFSSDTALMKFTPGQSEKTELINWLDSDVDGNTITVIGLTENGDVIATYNSGYGMEYEMSYNGGSVAFEDSEPEANIQIVTLKKTPASEVKQKEIITLACNYFDYNLRGAILDFNRTDPDYRVKVIDYSIYNTQDDYSAGVTKLNTEIISGNVPDLMLMNQLPFSIYASRGLLEDLYPYLEKDAELGGKEALTQAARNVMEDDNGKLLQVASGLTPITVLGDSRIVGSKVGWTMADLNAALTANPGARPFSFYMDRQQMLSAILIYNIDEYIDFEGGKVYFDSPEFISLIEFIKTFPEEFDWDSNYEYKDEMVEILNGKQLGNMTSFGNFDDYMRYEAQFGGNLAFKGFPCESENGSAFFPQSPMAMSTKCSNKDAAWKVMSMLISEKFQTSYNWYFPTNQKVFDKMAKDAMTDVTENPYGSGKGKTYSSRESAMVSAASSVSPVPDSVVEEPQGTITKDDGTKIYPKGWYYFDNQEFPYYAMTQEQYDKLLDFMNSVTKLAQENEQLSKIINDELSPFFAGQKSAADTVKIIQNRAHMYVSEQR
jgi:hypothetical protein